MYTSTPWTSYVATNGGVNESSSSTSWHADPDRANVITTTIGGSLSVIGVVFIAVSYFKLVEYNVGGTTAQTILLYISFADILAASSNVISVWFSAQKATAGCEAGAFIIIFASTASFFWTSCLAVHLYLIITSKSHLISQRKKMMTFHILSWGFPLSFSGFALGFDALGPSPILNKNESYIKLTTGGWCWIRDFDSKAKIVAWTMMTSKFWELASYMIITVLCCLIFMQLRWNVKMTASTIGEETLEEARKVERRIMFIPVAFILLRIWGTVRYFAYASSLSVRKSVLNNMVLYALQGLGDSSQGFANSLFFCVSNRRVLEYWKYALSNILPDFLCYRWESERISERSSLIHSLHVQDTARHESL